MKKLFNDRLYAAAICIVILVASGYMLYVYISVHQVTPAGTVRALK